MLDRAAPLALALLLAAPAGAIAQDLAGTLVVVNKGPSTVSIIDVATGALHGRLPTGDGPHEVVLTSDGSTAIVTDYGARTGGSSLTVVDVPGVRVVRTIDLGRHERPHGISVLPGDELVAVTSEASGHVVTVRISDGEIVSEIPTGHPGSHMLAMVADGGTIYTSNMGDDTVTRLDVKTGEATGSWGVAPRPEAIGVMPDGSEVWYGSNDEGTVSVLDPATGEIETPLTGFGWPYRVLFTPDQETVLLPDLGNHQLRIVDRASREARAVVDFPGAGPQGITLSADASVAFQSLSQQARIAVVDLRTHEVVRYIDTGQTPDGVAYTTRVPPTSGAR